MISESLQSGLLTYSTVTLFARFRDLSISLPIYQLAHRYSDGIRAICVPELGSRGKRNFYLEISIGFFLLVSIRSEVCQRSPDF